VIRTQPPLKHLTGLTIQTTPDHRSRVHIQANTDPKKMVGGLPLVPWRRRLKRK